MKNIYKILSIIFALVLFNSCENTKLGDIDLDFEANINAESSTSYIGKPIKIGIDVNILDPQNKHAFETKIKSPSGLLKSNFTAINSDAILNYDYRTQGTLYFEYTPTQKGKETITITIKNELVTRTASCEIECKDALYNIEIKDAPDRPLIDTKFDFNLLVNEMEATGADSIVTYAKVLKGEGMVFCGEQIINNVLTDDESEKNSSVSNKTQLAIGKNNISYISKVEGENIIRFYFNNKWGIETYQDISTNIYLPEWKLNNSGGKETVTIPYQDNYSFTLNVQEKDIFKDNTYEGFYRILSNTDLSLKINNIDYYQGSTVPLKAGGNVAVMKVNEAGVGSIEFIVKDKYKQEHKDTLRFTSLLPVKPIQGSLDKSSQSVKVNQSATFNLTLAEQNYSGLFDVRLEMISGSGDFESGNKLLFSEGTHILKYTPKTQGTHTFKITVKDGNNQEKILNATVQATISPLNASLSSTSLNLAQGEKGQIILTTSEADYTGTLDASYSVDGIAQKLEFGNINLGVGGKATFQQGTTTITITSSNIGTSNYTLLIEDIYKQSKELTFKVITKGKIIATAGDGGTVSGGGNFDLNQACTVKATPNTGFSFVGWYNGNTKLSDDATYTFNVTNSVSLEAKFSSKAYAISATAEEGGTAIGSGQYEHGKTATLKATVSAGYTFAGWYEGTTRVSTALEYTITVTANKTLVAKFTPNSYNITINAQTGGTVTGGDSYKHNSTATVTATVNTGYAFAGWYNGNTKVSDALKYTFTITGAVTLEARFTANKFSITVNAQEGGTVSGGGNYSYGENISVKATPSANYTFISWHEGDVQVSTSATYNFSVTKERTLEARFKMQDYTLTVTTGTGGSATGGGTYEYNKTVTLTATANTGYAFDGWYENGAKISGNISYVVKITGNRTIEAKFVANKFNVIVNAGDGGIANGSGAFSFSENVTVKATPSANYTFDGWYEGSTKVSTALTYTFKLQKETTLDARFTPNKYTITATGNGTQTGSGSYDYNTNATIKATPATNYTFTAWYEGNTQISTSNPYTFKVEKDRILEARYELVKYTVTATAGAGGTVSGSGTYVVNTECVLKAIPDAGVAFSGWYRNNNLVSTEATYKFNVTENLTVEARFAVNKYTVSATAEEGGTAIGSGQYEHGKTATLKATVSAGYTFGGWYEETTRVSTALEYTITVTSNKTFIAKFIPNSYNITVNAQTGGTATGGGSYKHNSTATVTATVNTGYAFAGWHNGNTKVSDALKYTFTITGAVTLEARFTANKYNIVVNALAGGTVTGSGSFEYNSNVTVKATANTGYTFAGWYVGANKVSDALSYTFSVTGSITLEARFTVNQFTIIVNALTGGSATGGGSYNYGTNVTVRATVNAGYTFAGWYKGTTKVSDALNYTFTVSEAATYEARFTINKYNVIVNTSGGGTVTGSGSFEYNSNVTIKATANTNYTFAGWYEGTTQVSTSASYTFKLLKETTLEARFTINKHTLTLSGVNGTQTGGGTYDYNTNVTIKATPNTNYSFTGWYEGTSQVSTSNPYTFALQKDRIFEAKYALVKRTVTLSTPTGGTVTGAGNFDHGTNVTVKATASTGYTFEGWYNGATKVSSSAEYTFTITTNITLLAKFTTNKYTVTLSAGTGGSVSGSGSFEHGSSVTVQATPATGYLFEGWYNGTIKVSSSANYTFTITGITSLSAKFTLNNYKVTVTAGTGGTASGGGTYSYNSQIVLTAIPKTGYMIEGWYNGTTKVFSDLNYVVVVKNNISYEARFKISEEKTKFYGSMIWAGHGGFGVTIEGYHPTYMKKNTTASFTYDIVTGSTGTIISSVLEGEGTVDVNRTTKTITVRPTSIRNFKIRLSSNTQSNPCVDITIIVMD